jgi:hypothetical protein
MALSQAMRDVIPTQTLLQEISAVIKLEAGSTYAQTTTVFEDNRGCVDIIKSPKVNPRTRHISIKHSITTFVRMGQPYKSTMD